MFRLMLSCCFVLFVSGSKIVEIESSSGKGRIVGGSTALRGQFPYQVSLRTGVYQSHFCGGFIITDRWIGTAAHCTIGRRPKEVVAVVGAVSRSLEGTEVTLNRFETHPEYDNSNLRNDITLIKTEKTIEFSLTVQPVRLGALNVEEGEYAVISGWGYTSNPGHAASNLQWITAKVVEVEECRNRLSTSNAAKVFDTSICAQAPVTGGACMGDSGGPLVGSNGVLIGISSWGVPCSMGFPDVYTRINSFHSWIDSVIDF